MIASLHSKALFKTALATLLLGLIAPLTMTSGSFAESGEYYTRKRVNGVWITGHFKRKNSAPETESGDAVPLPPTRPPSLGDIAYLDPAEDHPPAFQRAAEARQATGITETRQVTGNAEWAALPHEEPRLLPLQRALVAKARAMAEGLSERPRSVKAVTFDLEKGLRRNVYSDGSVVEEPFDPTTGAIGPLQ